jgi:hypothetical protein
MLINTPPCFWYLLVAPFSFDDPLDPLTDLHLNVCIDDVLYDEVKALLKLLD